jgi:hypothetical protein
VNADAALEIMEGQEAALDSFGALKNCLNGALITREDGKIALLIDDQQRLSELSQIIAQVKEAIAECVEMLAAEFQTVPVFNGMSTCTLLC